MKTRILIAASLLSLGSFASAQVFDWENLGLGNFSSVSQTVSGITATGTGVGGTIDVLDFGSFTNFSTFGTRSIVGGGDPRVAIRVDFSIDLTLLTVQFGDIGVDDDGTVTVTAYNSSNAVVDTNSMNYGLMDRPASLTLSAPDISYFIGVSGGPFPNTLVWDNMTVTPVPEPATMIALLAGVSALVARRRRKSAA
ncbi:MAG: PEP-CTERM sorting domain-containing protein [Armatimonadetes bacterium]|nr:PEP-CTERM sorting domain-containing protein [Armatimonadota bacterium]